MGLHEVYSDFLILGAFLKMAPLSDSFERTTRIGRVFSIMSGASRV